MAVEKTGSHPKRRQNRRRHKARQPPSDRSSAEEDDEEASEGEDVSDGEEDEKQKPKEALPLNFGKRLAHTDKVVRDRGFRFFKAWLRRSPDLERLDYLKLWKGLFFGMWMADKRPVQQDLAVKIALLINDIPHARQSMWIDTFWEIMLSTWEKLDTHRMSKFMQFCRIVVAESFKVLRVYGWKESEVKAFSRTYLRGAAEVKGGSSITGVGLIHHFTHFFWDEMNYQLEQTPKAAPERIMLLLEPFYALCETCLNRSLVTGINTGILRQVPPDVAPHLIQRIEASITNLDLQLFQREALAATAKALGASDLPVPEKPKLTKKERMRQKQKDRTDFVAQQRRKRKHITSKGQFAEDFLAKGRRLDDEAEGKTAASPKETRSSPAAAGGRGVGEANEPGSSGAAVASAAMSPLVLPQAAVQEDGLLPGGKATRRQAAGDEALGAPRRKTKVKKKKADAGPSRTKRKGF